MTTTINTTFFQLVAAFFIAFILGHMTTKYFERFERFPSPLVTMGPELPAMVQGRDYIPHRLKPTLPPGPNMPSPLEVDAALYETTPPTPVGVMPTLPVSTTNITNATNAPKLPYPMASDDFLSFLSPDKSLTLAPTRAP